MRIAAIGLMVALFLLDGSVRSGNEVTLSGEFHWKHMNHTGDLDASFAQTGAETWAVEFRFVWDGEAHVYRGTAEGDLIDGELRGSIVTDNASRPQVFLFDGSFEHGRFTGSHTAVQAGGGKHPTGTLTLSR